MREQEALVDKSATGLMGLIFGAILGVPASYFIQSGAVRAKMSLTAYLTNLPDLLAKYPGDMLPPVLISCAVFAVGGWLLGRKMGTASAPAK
jgi:hypothetical protein